MSSSSLTTTQGFHTVCTTTTTFTRGILQHTNCGFYIVYDIPPDVFVDPYELAHYKDLYTFRLSGTINLELPATAVMSGVGLLLNVSTSQQVESGSMSVSVPVPLHMRYGKLAVSGSPGYHDKRVPSPLTYIACPVDSETASRPTPPFGIPSQFHSFFNSHTVSPIPPDPDAISDLVVRIPLGRVDDLMIVELGTTCVIIFAFTLILHSSIRAAARLAHSKIHVKSD